ncbi:MULTISPECIES: Fur family transcriptional regulator [unclassified Leifsonia]|uniref:Fur family transcriptional regulator n=1 Tax=unclassified Leifsonia TaxID=2663824 RepID=UPI0006F8582E|nr:MULTISPECIES: Fur family transcriptional regulator [unclassified Leifsonia]KQX06434.1 Fur family transcriptional regulator [Leifsonia sp. Root1293]KRA10717.1 Fur family transcriptional regulator [Leifsonia sp. Root60]
MSSSREREIRVAGLRVTAGRLALLDAVDSFPHSDAATLHRHLVDSGVGSSIQAVHNMLADLSAAGLLRRIEPADSAALYERRVGDNHHHIVCTSCGAVADVECVVGHAPCLTPSDTAGFALTTAEITFWGLCAPCQKMHEAHTKEIHD